MTRDLDDLNLRPYGHPGKFEGGLAIDEWASSATMEGADDEVSIPDGGGWWGLLRGPFSPERDGISPADVENFAFTADELAFLASVAGAIVHEDSAGFVNVEWFTHGAKLSADWDAIVADVCPDDESAD